MTNERPELLADTWSWREFPVLREAARVIEEGPPRVGARFHEISDRTGLDVDDVYRAVQALEGEGLVDAIWSNPGRASRVTSLSGAVRRKVGLWPDVDRATQDFLRFLDRQVETAPTEERNWWRRIRDTFGEATQDLTAKVIAEVVARQAGL